MPPAGGAAVFDHRKPCRDQEGSTRLSTIARLRCFFLTHLSLPSSNRPVYQTVRKRKSRAILEIGVGNAQRALGMIAVASCAWPPSSIRYTGIDLFEAGTGSGRPHLSLKEAHRLLRATGAVVRLVPGSPLDALRQTANNIGPADLIVVSQWLASALNPEVWFYFPRMMHADSLVLIQKSEASGRIKTGRLSADQVRQLAGRASWQRAA